MVNYQNGKIYMIESLEGDCKYYGSTVQSLALRLSKHRNEIKAGKNPSSKKVLKYQDARILLVELYPCNSKMELESKEAEYIRHNDCVNKRIPQRTDKQYYQDNKVKKIQRVSQYYQKNKDKKLDYAKQYNQKNKDKIDEKRNKKYICDCGKETNNRHYKRHEKSQQHTNWQKIYDFIIS